MSTPKAQYNLKELRQQKGMTQKQLAAATGVKERIISKIERNQLEGTYPDDITRLIAYLGQVFTNVC